MAEGCGKSFFLRLLPADDLSRRVLGPIRRWLQVTRRVEQFPNVKKCKLGDFL